MAVISYRPQYTIADYEQWKGDWELWDGLAISLLPSPGITHQRVSGNLLTQLHAFVNSGACCDGSQVLYGIDWRVSDNAVVRPDLLVLCEEPETEWVEKRPELITEILSPSTRTKDLTSKRELYAVQGVPIYLVIDPAGESVLLLRLDDEGTYRELDPDDSFELHEGCVLKLDQKALFS